MRASTEEFLYVLWFTADTFLRPSWCNVLGPDFDGWAWRNGLTRRLAQLEQQKLLESHPGGGSTSERIVRLTEAGQLAALGGRDPVARWARPWDGRWRLILFDLPLDAKALRIKLHRLLRARHFGYLQGNVWLTPDSVEDLRTIVGNTSVDPEGFIVFEGRPATGESDTAIVTGAWDFAEINRRYERHLDFLRTAPRTVNAGAAGRKRLHTWAQLEHAAWKHAVTLDPLLPLTLLPADYRGRAAWTARCDALVSLARHLA